MAPISRRYFMFGTLLTGALPRPSIASLKALGYQSPNEKLNIAGIGAGGQPLSDMRQCQGENIVALADVDWRRSEQGFKTLEKATKYKDFRQMLDEEGKNIDAVVIGTPDHMHAYAALACMQTGKSVYVEKPLTRTPWEARLLTQAAEKYKVATQMGNQGYSHDATRVACEIFWSGEIGEVREVHAWTGRASWPQEMPFTFPDELTIKYEFGARGGMPPVTVYWYHSPSGDAYSPPAMTVEQARKIPGKGPQVGPVGGARPAGAPGGTTSAGSPPRPPQGIGYNSIFVGSKGYIGTSGRGEGVGLLPGERWAKYQLPAEYLSRAPGASTGSNHAAHVRDWIRACKGGQTTRVITTHPDQFACVAVWSAGVNPQTNADFEKRNAAFLASADKLNKQIKLFSISVGDKDFALAGSNNLIELLKKNNIKHEHNISGGGHTWINWRRYLNELAPRLFRMAGE